MNHDRRDLIRESAQRVRQSKSVPSRAQLKGRWRRTASKTLTLYNVSLSDAYGMIYRAFEEKSDRGEPIGRQKIHVQLFGWERMP